ncbi:MAG: alpha-N-arabinofuranosidase 1 [Prevotella sp.]|nr:alpha-N-arabinofuranosidase 1 [Prevotella sp.]
MLQRNLLSTLFSVAIMSASAQTVMTIDATQRGPMISDHQYGLFFEEINHAGEGGLYAELVKNRSFEQGLDAWTAYNGAAITLQTTDLMNSVQKTALSLTTAGASATNMKGVSNAGYWGMGIKTDSTYTLTLWAKGSAVFVNHLKAQLRSEDGNTVLGEATLAGTINNTGWNKLSATIKATGSDKKGQLMLLTDAGGKIAIDMVSLFPYTWKNRKNGLRPDLAQLLADTRPSFLRFPGGCYVEGEGSYDNAFQWKKTIGPIETRPGHLNQNWHYFSSDGLGYDEYLQLSEDLGAAPLFVVNVGLGHGFTLSLDETKTLVQDALDAIEYANGDASTEWGAKRVANGHPQPYNLKFIEIGNENYQTDAAAQSDQYAERYNMFYTAIKAKYPEIKCIGNVEAWGTDNPSWRNEYPVELVDEHYYRSYDWMRNNYNKYDNYPRSIGVYNGEYAANGSGWGLYGNMNSALGEAIYMLGMERNSDVCRMASFAPIFTHESDPLWAYDMIHFNAADHFVTPSYYVQKLLGNNLGKQNLLWTESGNNTQPNLISDMVGVGAWNTQVVYDDVRVSDANGNPIAQDDFSNGTAAWTLNTGYWSADGAELAQTQQAENCTAILNVPVSGSNYIYKVRAKKTGGNEGFLILFNYQDAKNYIWWNLGGWNNTKHGVERCVNGAKTTLASVGGAVETDRWYDIEIDVTGNQVTCKLDGNIIHEFSVPSDRALYQSVQIDEERGEMILKVVNPNASAQQLQLNVKNMKLGNGTVVRLSSAAGTDENTMDSPDLVIPSQEDMVTVSSPAQATFDIPAYSLNIYRLKVSEVGTEVSETYPAYEQEDAGKSAYLFAHMHRSNEYTAYALSLYGQNWNDLLDGAEVFDTKANTVTGGMRDAYICRTEDGNFMLAGTDMTSRLGWTSNHIMDLMLSPDLVHWTKNVKIDLESDENLLALGGITADDMTAAWAPQIIYDRESGNYVLYYSVGFPDRHRIYYQLVDKDLNILTKPALYFDPGYDIIDADIVWNDVDQQYQMVYKSEQGAGFYRATATHLVPTATETSDTRQWSQTADFHVNENNQSIEAPTQWRLIGSNRWKLAYINYSGSGYGYKMRDMDEHGLNVGSPVGINGNVAAQHGSILKITMDEYNYLKTWEQVKTMLPTVEGYYKASQNETIGQAIEKANQALTTSTTFAENVTAMSEALTAMQGCKAIYDAFIQDLARQGRAADLTPLLQNPYFSEGGTGWEKSPSFTQANGQVAEFWNTTFDMHQTLDNLPKGDYELTVQSFYRNGDITPAVTSHNDGTEQLNAMFYANEVETPVMSLYDNSVTQYSITPYTFPNNVTVANQAFNTEGLYTNTLKLTLPAAGRITLGIRKTVGVQGDWCCFDNFTLKYLGDPTGISVFPVTKTVPDAIYNLKGQRMGNGKLPHGIYIKNGKKTVL